ncbi:MAG: cupin domain-containing protein [Alphaproteobacteria bacterium]|nr:cupin domain-containing protein [Alphaproteobacteria bacterium]
MAAEGLSAPGDAADDRQAAFHRRIGAKHLAALWVARRGVDLSKPAAPTAPALWRFAEMRPEIMTAGALIRAEDAFRRVLVLENPAFAGELRATNTLYAGLQLVLPGEIAPCHRHTQTALRFVIEGEGAYSTVDGERTRLHPGDFVVTPQWSWHDHVNEGAGPVIWLDVLDTPLVGFLDTVFRESWTAPLYPVRRPDDTAPALYGAGLVPEGAGPAHDASPVVNYRYATARPALARLAAAGDIDPCHGHRLRYAHPMTGGYATPTMAAFLQALPAGFRGALYRSTDAQIVCVADGSGRTTIGSRTFDWTRGDVFVIPGWHAYAHAADETGAVLFSVSDRAAQEALGLWREDRTA